MKIREAFWDEIKYLIEDGNLDPNLELQAEAIYELILTLDLVIQDSDSAIITKENTEYRHRRIKRMMITRLMKYLTEYCGEEFQEFLFNRLKTNGT